MAHIVVVGAGQAGASLVAKLRAEGFEGDLTLIGAEDAPPYQRPPLSKKYLMGEIDRERLYLRPMAFYADQQISLRLGTPVSAVNATDRTLRLGDEVIHWDQLAFTTGSTPRRLPAAIGGDLAGVYAVRDLADVDAMAAEFQPGRRVLIIGGGYIGLEAAAVAASKDLKVTLVEMADRILQRVAAPQTSDYFRELHKSKGVDLREGIGLERLTGEARVDGADLGDGSHLEIDFAIVGVGITPVVDLAEAAGAKIEDGIWTDEFGRTTLPDVWAAGDCASFPYRGGRLRLESVPNAIDQAEAVAMNMLGANREYVATPWFWSDQYDIKLQIAGLGKGYNEIVTRQGDTGVSFWYYNDDKLLAVDAMNDPRGYMIGKRLIEAGKSPDKTVIADTGSDLKALLKS